MAPSRHDWKIVDWDVKPQHNQPTTQLSIVAHGPLVFNWDNLLKGCYFFMGMEIFYKHLVPHK